MPLRTLNIIGAGRVGQTLGRLFHTHACFKINGIVNKRLEQAEKAVNFIDAGTAYSTLDDLPASDVYMITTPDAEITPIAQALSQSLPNKQTIVFHCSGALPSTTLSPLPNIASIHPLMTFATTESSIDHLTGVYCALEGNSTACEILQGAFSTIGSTVFSIPTEKKAMYHAASTMACNYLITLIDIAADMYKECGLTKDQAFSMMQPTLQKTIDNVFAMGPAKALTGPIARGDAETIQIHLDAIQNPSVKNLYSLLGEKTVSLSTQKGDATSTNLGKIKHILSSNIKTSAN